MRKIIVSIIMIGFLLNAIPISIGGVEKCSVLNSSVILDDAQDVDQFIKSQMTYVDDEDEIVLTFSFGSPVLTEFVRDGKTYSRVAMEGLPVIGDFGVPLLPVKPVNILLPQRAKVESISVVKGEAVVLGDGYDVELGAKPVVIDDAVSEDELCEDVRFNPVLPYPNVDFVDVGTYSFRGYSILTLVLYPVRYVGQDREIFYYDEMRVTVETVETFSVNPLFRGSPVDDMMVREMVDDCRMSETYFISDPLSFPCSLFDPSENYEYVIITNETLKNASGSYTFQDLIQYKIDNGISAIIVTVEEIYSHYDGVDDADKIRNFIKDAYVNHGTEYVLLGGDSDVVPARIFWVESDPGGLDCNPPSDLYYGCLDGSFNSNGDDIWGEPTDGENGGDVDLVAEVYVGRACAGDSNEVSNFVMKTLAYEQKSESAPYLRKALMVGSELGFGGVSDYASDSLDETIDGSDAQGYSTVGIPSDEYQIDKLYDSPGYEWSTSDLVDRMNSEVNIINHLGHGEIEGWTYKLYSGDVSQLNNINYSFIYSQACLVGLFDSYYSSYIDCFAEYLTVKTGNASFAVIMNSDYGWGKRNSTDGPSQRFAREFFDSIFNEGVRDPRKACLGVANQDSKEDNLWRVNEPCMRWCYYELNLFGDPQASLKPIPVYDHDVAIDSLELSGNVLPGESFELNMTVVNQGLNNEIDISGVISITEVLTNKLIYEYPWTINYLASGDAASVEITYSLPRGLYRMSADIDALPGEDIVFNNHMNFAVFIGESSPPKKPARPSGSAKGKAGVEYTYSTCTTDPDDDKLYYKWCWIYYDPEYPPSSTCSEWFGPFDSGETVYTSHIWYEPGTYAVKVIAKDPSGAFSEWSDPLSIVMPKNQQNSQQSKVKTIMFELLYLWLLEKYSVSGYGLFLKIMLSLLINS